MLTAFQMLAEERIRTSIERGELDDLPGKGKPLHLAENTYVPEDCRMAFKLLKNAGYVPQEIADRKEMLSLEEALSREEDASVKLKQIKRLHYLIAKLGSSHLGKCLLEDNPYYTRLVDSTSVRKR